MGGSGARREGKESPLLQKGEIDLLRRCFAAGRVRDSDYHVADEGELPPRELMDSAASFLSDLKPNEPAGLPVPVWQVLALSCFVGAEMLAEEAAADALLIRCDIAMRLIQALPFVGI